MITSIAKNLKEFRLSDLAKKFSASTSGSFIPTFAIGMMAVFMSAGAAIDYSQLSRAKMIMSDSLDAAILAAGGEFIRTGPSDTELREIFENHFYATLARDPNLVDSAVIDSFSFNRMTGKVNAEVSSPVQMAFMGIIGKPEIEVTSVSEATFSNTPVEVSMVLDVTGSMNANGKLDSLKLAAKDAIDLLLPETSSNPNVKIGIVPYSEGVRVDSGLATTASGQSSYTCMTERTVNPHNDVSYRSEYVGADDRANCSTSRIQPLTNNGAGLKTEIDNFFAPPDAYTAGHLGVAWGYYMLSQQWQGLWPTDSRPADFASNTKKIAIIMTDGEFNTYFNGVSGRPQGTQRNKSEDDAIALCSDMKRNRGGNNGITVYSIAFDAPPRARSVLQNCATPDTSDTRHFYDASNEEELRTAFREIAESIKVLRLSR